MIKITYVKDVSEVELAKKIKQMLNKAKTSADVKVENYGRHGPQGQGRMKTTHM